MEPYIPRLEKLVSKKVHLMDTYLASEGYFAYQRSPERKCMQLLLDAGTFYEFVPFNSTFFDETGAVKDSYKALTLSEVTEGVDYAMVITTNAGLWRYMIGDLVQFVNVDEREIRITGRIKQFLSLVGEHLSLDNINSAVHHASVQLGVEIPEFSLFADTDNQRHIWYIGTNDEVNKLDLMHKIDIRLCELNDDYASVRKYSLNTPEIYSVPVNRFYAFLDAIGKSGSQNKFPRVMNDTQSKQWIDFNAQFVD